LAAARTVFPRESPDLTFPEMPEFVSIFLIKLDAMRLHANANSTPAS
jgi:hypothetical protein